MRFTDLSVVFYYTANSNPLVLGKSLKNPKYHLYLSPDERRTVINSLIDLRNNLIAQGRYTDIIDELLIKLTKAKVKKIKVKEV